MSEEAVELAKEMWNIVKKYPCSGMAAVQVSVPKQLFLACVPSRFPHETIIGEKIEDDSSKSRFAVILNPMIVRVSREVDFMTESCMSIPNTLCLVCRNSEVFIRYQTLGSKDYFVSHLKGIWARIFQHEFDHLNGVLITDRHRNPRDFLTNNYDIEKFEEELKNIPAYEFWK